MRQDGRSFDLYSSISGAMYETNDSVVITGYDAMETRLTQTENFSSSSANKEDYHHSRLGGH